MRAVRYEEFKGDIRISEVGLPAVPDDGVMIEVKATGICRSDWWGWQGHDQGIRLPHVPGHEFAGIVKDVGSAVRSVRPGMRATVPFVNGCGECIFCKSGQAHVCEFQTQPGFTHWGSFADRVIVRNADFNIVELPESIDFITAASLGCRFATAYRAVVDQSGLSKGQSLVVMGCGGVGLSAISIASAIGIETVAVDISDNKLQLARKLGATYTINTADEDYSPEAVEIMLDGGAYATLDALGKGELLEMGIRSLRPQGTHIQVGLMETSASTIDANTITARELSIRGSHGLPASEYPRMLELVASGACDPRHLVTAIISLEQAPRVLMRFGEAAPVGVVVIDMEM